MTRQRGQVTTAQAVVGLLSAAVATVAMVLALGLLLPVTERLEPFEAPGSLDFEEGCPDGPFEEPVRVGAAVLFECPRQLDGVQVRYEGEAVRAILRRGDHAWLHVNDDQYASLGPLPEHRTTLGGNSGVPVRLPDQLADVVTIVGNHRARGDVIEVIGVFRRADPLDGGGPAIRAEQARVVVPGATISRNVDRVRLLVALTMLLIAAGVALLARRARRR